jgi:hypothetical protein
MNVRAGQFYEFMRQRNVARAGQPLHPVGGIEIGQQLAAERAFAMVKAGHDVYTPNESDAYSLAARVDPRTPKNEIHRAKPSAPTRSGRDDVYFPHYHPGNNRIYGHIFFGHRGQGL